MSNTVGSILHRNLSNDLPTYLYVPRDDVRLKSILDNVEANFMAIPTTRSPVSMMNFDAVISTDRTSEFKSLFELAHKLHIPLVCYESLLPPSPEVVQEIRQLSSPINIFSQNTLSQYWGITNYQVLSPVIELPPVDDMAKNHSAVYFTTDANGQDLVNLVREKNLSAVLVEQNTDVSKIHFYVNTLLQPNTVDTLLALMARGVIVITLKHPLINEIIIDQYNGISATDVVELKHKLEALFRNRDAHNRLAVNAKATIAKQFNKDIFKKRWKSVEKEIKSYTFKGIL